MANAAQIPQFHLGPASRVSTYLAAFPFEHRIGGIGEYRGWSLYGFTLPSEPYADTGFVARSASGVAMIGVSQFGFTPSQSRFNWLVDWSFPCGYVGATGARVPLTDEVIDAAIAQQVAA